MNKKESKRFEKLLLEEKTKISAHLQDLSANAEHDLEETPSGDSADIASLEINQANMQKIGKRESQLLKKIEKALGKIKEGTYGECENCGEEIAVARLEARPVAELCIDCKTEQENEERRYSSGVEEPEDDVEFQEGSEEG